MRRDGPVSWAQNNLTTQMASNPEGVGGFCDVACAARGDVLVRLPDAGRRTVRVSPVATTSLTHENREGGSPGAPPSDRALPCLESWRLDGDCSRGVMRIRVKGLPIGETAEFPSNVTTMKKLIAACRLGAVEGGETNRAADPGFSRIASPTDPQKKLSPCALGMGAAAWSPGLHTPQQGLSSILDFLAEE
ncbi:hypothetical protein INS49_013980 [Diaporthe citri]|uniref:uncharacterized protein n=1 Tax=Diaporthe citri TaxID=83186 RepID=UPI001C7E718A|nr:uncharacterized protein INS49_013980 [Diaporthe citri]KAG6358096.1 hypothetical protein INS49_013980 [Diaporthe citri]